MKYKIDPKEDILSAALLLHMNNTGSYTLSIEEYNYYLNGVVHRLKNWHSSELNGGKYEPFDNSVKDLLNVVIIECGECNGN
jgi:hypothetical protein